MVPILPVDVADIIDWSSYRSVAWLRRYNSDRPKTEYRFSVKNIILPNNKVISQQSPFEHLV